MVSISMFESRKNKDFVKKSRQKYTKLCKIHLIIYVNYGTITKMNKFKEGI